MQFDAFGRLPLGQINEAHDGQGSPVGVAATGQAGSLSKIVAKTPTGVSATGFAGTAASSVAKPITGVAGTCALGTIDKQISKQPSGVSATGAAGTLSKIVAKTAFGVVGSTIVGTVAAWVQAQISGVSATGFIGQQTANPGSNPIGTSATGIAGDLSIVVSGGGTSGDGERNDPPLRRDPRIRTGLEPIAKVHAPPPRPPAPPLIPLPPRWMRPAPAIVPGLDPVEYSDPVATQAMPDIARQILEASRESERIADERDIEDIADMVALLDD